jgi:glucan biosynthesis protein C
VHAREGRRVRLAPLALRPFIEPVLLVALTLAGCWLLTDGVIRRVNLLRPLFGLKPTQPASSQPLEPRPPARGWRCRSPRA